MEIKTGVLNIKKNALDSCFFVLPQPREKICFFDIETTGLSPRVSSLYLVGAACFQDGEMRLTQWFADDYTSERDILDSFAEFLADFSTLVHYNGSTFDIPYLEAKYKEHELPSPFSGKDNLDLLKPARKNKVLWNTPDQKLVTMEQTFGFQRADSFSGKDCIRLYTEFMQKKFFHDAVSNDRKKSLLQHNHDDLAGTVFCCQVMLYCRYIPVSPQCKLQAKSFLLEDTMTLPFPLDCRSKKDDISIHFQGTRIQFEIPLYEGTLYHFYDNYKDYYYLPKEDMAVHKSVGIYVDPEHREKAKASNCYTKKSGLFLPLPKGMSFDRHPLFRESRKNPRSYLYISDMDFSLTKDEITSYIQFVMVC